MLEVNAEDAEEVPRAGRVHGGLEEGENPDAKFYAEQL